MPFEILCDVMHIGLVKVLSCKETDKILGAWILGPSAGRLQSSELVQPVDA